MRTSLIPLLILAIVAIGAFIFAFGQILKEDDAPVQTEATAVRAYMDEHISELSWKHAVLGGTFYVTRMEAAGGHGVVYYEDGHVAYIANFGYEISPQGEVSILYFEIPGQAS